MPKTQLVNEPQSALQMLQAQARRIPLLTAAEEVELTIIARAGGPEGIRARDKMVAANLRYVISAAWKQVRPNVSIEDLIQEGNMGLMKAVEKFDETRGFRFLTYANWWVRQYMTRCLEENGYALRLPNQSAQAIARMNRSVAKLSRGGREPSDAEVAADMGVSIEKVHELAEWSRQPISLNTPIFDGDGEFGDRIEDTHSVDPEAAVMAVDMKERLTASLSKLKDRSREIIVLRFGLEGHKEHTLDEVGKIYNLTRERIRQIEAKALDTLRGGDSGRALKSFL